MWASVLAAPAAGQAAPAPPTKLAYINATAILQGMPGYAQAESLFVKERDAAQGEVDKLRQGFDSLVAEFEQQQAILSPSNRAAKRKSLEAEQARVSQRVQDLSDRVARREQELLAPMRQRLTAIVDGIRAEGNYAIIFDIAQLSPAVISLDTSLDITSRVLERLRQSN